MDPLEGLHDHLGVRVRAEQLQGDQLQRDERAQVQGVEAQRVEPVEPRRTVVDRVDTPQRRHLVRQPVACVVDGLGHQQAVRGAQRERGPGRPEAVQRRPGAACDELRGDDRREGRHGAGDGQVREVGAQVVAVGDPVLAERPRSFGGGDPRPADRRQRGRHGHGGDPPAEPSGKPRLDRRPCGGERPGAEHHQRQERPGARRPVLGGAAQRCGHPASLRSRSRSRSDE